MKTFSRDETREALAFDRLIPALRNAFAQPCHVPLRHTHQIQSATGHMTSLLMPAWTENDLFGIKVINIAPGNSQLGKPGLHSIYLLCDAVTGEPLAMMDGDEITSRRTAGASALAASYLAREDASQLLIVGAGRVASLLADAYATIRPIKHVQVWNARPASAHRLVEQLTEQGYKAAVAPDLAQAVQAADIVTCATLAKEPVIRGEWLRPGSHLDLIGSFTPDRREADDECFRDARIYVDTDEALVKSGELLGPLSRQVFTSNDIVATLDQLVTGKRPGRGSTQEKTVFKSVGTALEDLAAATLVWRNNSYQPHN